MLDQFPRIRVDRGELRGRETSAPRWIFSGQHEVQNAPDGVDVHILVIPFAADFSTTKITGRLKCSVPLTELCIPEYRRVTQVVDTAVLASRDRSPLLSKHVFGCWPRFIICASSMQPLDIHGNIAIFCISDCKTYYPHDSSLVRLLRDEHVVRAEVAVHDALAVRAHNRVLQLQEDGDG
jgi:hypothetical protein